MQSGIRGTLVSCSVIQPDKGAACQVEAALASAERQIERLRNRERMHARGVVEARNQLVEASSASSVISEDGPLTPEAGQAQAHTSNTTWPCLYDLSSYLLISSRGRSSTKPGTMLP